MIGYILGLGDRHIQNILVDQNTAELVHIDFGFAFEQSKILPTPETVPFRLTRDIIDGFGPCGVEGTFRKAAEATLKVKKYSWIPDADMIDFLETFFEQLSEDFWDILLYEFRYSYRFKIVIYIINPPKLF